MNHRMVQVFCIAVAGVLLAGSALSVGAVPAGATPNPNVSLTVKITADPSSSIIWGKVKTSYKVGKTMTTRTCPTAAQPNTATCVYSVPKDTSIHFIEIPKDSTTWPFKEWQIKKGNGPVTKSTKTQIARAFSSPTNSVTAVYTIP